MSPSRRTSRFGSPVLPLVGSVTVPPGSRVAQGILTDRSVIGCRSGAERRRLPPGTAPRGASVPLAMAEWTPKGRGLERVLGTGALFSTAYGNVGSSIYYALGLVAVLALGMTPVVFAIAGVIFVFTAFTYTQATTMYPEAGGASLFAGPGFTQVLWRAEER